MMTDSIADMLTRIRNANRIERPVVEMPATYLKRNVAAVLKDEGYIQGFELGEYAVNDQGQKSWEPREVIGPKKTFLRVFMKYGPDGEKVIQRIERASRPGRRLYRRSTQLAPVLEGLGIAILSTSKGVMSDRRARAEKVGGELLCTVY